VPGGDLTLPGVEARVALLLPLTGRHAKVGQALLNAAQLALFDTPEQRFALLVRDTGGTPQGAAAAARDALADGASLILGPLFATEVQAMALEAQRAGVAVVSFSNDREVAGGGVFVMGLNPRLQVERVVAFASQQGLRRFAVLAPASAYGDAVLRAMQSAVVGNGAQLTRALSYDPAIGDASAEVRSLAEYDRRRQALIAERQRLSDRDDAESKRALRQLEGLDTLGPPNYDAVMLPAGGETLLALVPLLPYYDIDPKEVRYLGTALWDDPALATEPALVGGWFAAPPPQLWQSFRARYQQTYGDAPPRIASLAYDATALAAVLAGRAFADGRRSAYELESVSQASGFSGVDGIFRFLPDGESQRGLAVLEMQRGGLTVRDPAPQTFEPLTF
jgi:ABC-type branched-subunit amino acid transport system substrate-binding protein